MLDHEDNQDIHLTVLDMTDCAVIADAKPKKGRCRMDEPFGVSQRITLLRVPQHFLLDSFGNGRGQFPQLLDGLFGPPEGMRHWRSIASTSFGVKVWPRFTWCRPFWISFS